MRALKGVSLTIAPGESLGIADQFGSGKPTLGRRFVGLEAPDAGSIEIDGLDAGHVQGLGPQDRARLRRKVQMVFRTPARR